MKRETPNVTVPIGIAGGAGRQFTLAWDSHQVVNGHFALVGGTGSGKTYQLTRFVDGLAGGGVRIHLIDVHGDIHPTMPTSSVLFSESTEFGLNPLAVSPDPHHGGVRKRANAFIALLMRQMTLGEKQKSALYRLLVDLYKSYGFYVSEPSTWSLSHDPRAWARSRKRQPTLSDLTRHVEQRLKTMKFGMTGQAVQAFEDVAKLQKQMHRLRIKKARGEDVEAQLQAKREKAVEAFENGLLRLETGDELEDLIAWDSADAIKGLYDRLTSLEASGIFRGRAPSFDPSCPVWRYDISPLSRAEQQFFVQCLAEQIFYEAKERGEAQGPDTALIIDEAVNHVDDDDDHIVNVMIREVRKFGVMIGLAAQEMGSFPKAVLSGTATKIILGVDSTEQKALERKLGLTEGKLRYLKPQHTALVQVQRRGKMQGGDGYTEVSVIG